MEKPARDGRIDRMGDAPIGERISAGAVLVGLAPVCVRCVRGGSAGAWVELRELNPFKCADAPCKWPLRFAATGIGEFMRIKMKSIDEGGLRMYSGMTDGQLRRGEGLGRALAGGVFIAESRRVAERALDRGIEPVSVFVEEKWFDHELPLIERIERTWPDVPVYIATAGQFHDITGYEVTRGALIAFKRPPLPDPADLLERARRVAIIEDVTNYANMGAIFRSAAALGVDAVLVSPSCHDPFYRRCARVSMGTVFQVPWTRIPGEREWAPAAVPLLRRAGFTTVALALHDDSIQLDDPRLRACERLAVVLGTEGGGLFQSTIDACDYTVTIPMAHDVDSLNVAAAAAVAFWELRVRS